MSRSHTRRAKREERRQTLRRVKRQRYLDRRAKQRKVHAR